MMNKRRAFTLVELLVVISVIAILMAILMPALNSARELGKRSVCLGNQKNLTLAWNMYADDNDDKLVNGDIGEHPNIHGNENSWVENDWTGTREQKEQAIKDGALWPYSKSLKIYLCPVIPRNQTFEIARSFSIVDSMNAANSLDSDDLTLRTRSEIKQPAYRAVLLDDGGYGNNIRGAWGIWIRSWRWNDPPPIIHSDGTNWSYADGHSDYHKWEDQRTFDWALENPGRANGGDAPGSVDLIFVGEVVWGTSGKTWYAANMP
ncbi:type II secretion system protein [Planctomycetota bacterium]